MYILLFLWALGSADSIGIDLMRHGFTDANFIGFYAVGKRILVVGTTLNQVGLFERNGELVTLLDEASVKPEAWVTPLGLGVTEQEILLVSGGRKVLAFDHQLKPVASSYPALTKSMMAGEALGGDRFLLFTFINESHGLTRVALSKGEWRVKREMFPMEYAENQPEGQPPAPKFWLTFHHGRAFQWHPLVMGDKQYQIDVFDISGEGEEEQVAVLQNSLEDVPGIDESWPALVSATRLGNQLAVGLLLLDPQTFAPLLRRVDIFDENGAFQERREQPKTLDLKPLQGTDQVLALDTESMILKSYH